MNAPTHQFTTAPESPIKAYIRNMEARTAAERDALAAFIAAHDDVLSGEIVHRGAAGAEYHLTVNAGEWITTGIGWTLEAARLSALDTHDNEVRQLVEYLAKGQRAYVRSAL